MSGCVAHTKAFVAWNTSNSIGHNQERVTTKSSCWLQVLLNIVNFSKTKSLYREGLAPVVCSRGRPHWNRIPSSQVLYYRSPKGPGNRMAYVMSFLFKFDVAAAAPYFFAYAFPYTYTDLQRYLYRDPYFVSWNGTRIRVFQLGIAAHEVLLSFIPGSHARDNASATKQFHLCTYTGRFIWCSYCCAAPFDVSSLFPDNMMASLERLKLPFLQREALCRTLQQRRVDLLTITAPEGEPGTRPLRERKWVFMSARVHPGETPAQFIIHGVIDFLTGESPRARALRGNVVFKIVPMLNPDGVVNGNYRCSYLGFDLNRHWLDPTAWAQPEILSVKTLVAELHEDPSVDLDFYVAAAAAGSANRKNKPRERQEGGGCSSNGKVRSSRAVARGKAAGELVEDDDTTAYSGVSSVFPRMLAANAPDFSFARSRFDADPNDWRQRFPTTTGCQGPKTSR
ncbi:ATP/GTP binding protein-like 4 [Ectocarpus siliculosus]|uniref:ATP/GTP binding protein-like 4 n=1 Tax=Ectocarpus siliculosus TaxID=2880 RepID=D7G4C7_ECTSI|nr:ATP/GTP binding protein-like 4 [Ectocarpus siliculosus]|eukprot:CBJ33673.1 ATP/GTP binding protein-like 4 [Ectocarpus siliculosus]